MLKKLMIGLLALSLTAIWVSEASALLAIRKRASTRVTVIGGQGGDTFVTDLFGLPKGGDGLGCGQIKGDVYCLEANADADACDKATGYSTALVLTTDTDFIKPKTKPYRWTDYDLNADIADFGQRKQLRVMEQLSSSEDPDVFTIKLPVGGDINKAGIHALSTALINYWKSVTGATTVSDALRSYVGKPNANGILIPDDGFGTNTDNYLQGLPEGSVIPLYGNELQKLKDHVVCFVSNTANIGGEDLHGKYYGTWAAKVLAVAADNLSLTMEVMDSDEVCRLTLDNDYTATPEPENPTGCTKVPDQLVFAPAPCDYVPYNDDADAYPAQSGTIYCDDVLCKGTAEVELKNTIGQGFCPAGTTFKKFIPKDYGVGTYAGYAFIGTVDSATNPALKDLVICGETVPGGGQGVEYSRYGCVPLGDVLDPAVIPDCCGCSSWVQQP